MDFSRYLKDLKKQSRCCFTLFEAEKAVKIRKQSLLTALNRATNKGEILCMKNKIY